jgi:hypothetical protein
MMSEKAPPPTTADEEGVVEGLAREIRNADVFGGYEAVARFVLEREREVLSPTSLCATWNRWGHECGERALHPCTRCQRLAQLGCALGRSNGE